MNFLTAISERAKHLAREMSLGVVYRLLAMGAYAVSLPMLLELLGARELGVWLVISTAVQWVLFYDLGISSGARNEIARAAANNDSDWTQRAIATGWFYSAVIAAGIFALCATALAFSASQHWIRTNIFDGIDGTHALWIGLAGACLTLFLKFGQVALAALERASYLSLFGALSGWLLVLGLLVAPMIASIGLTGVAVLQALAAFTANVLIIAKFMHAFPALRFRFGSIDHKLRHSIMGFGLRLFVVQIAAMIIFATDEILVSAFIGPEEVVVYDAGLKLFSIVTMLHVVIMGTLWSSFTQAHARGEWEWIRVTLRRLVLWIAPLGIGVLLLAYLSPTIVEYWLGPANVGAMLLYLMFAAVTIVTCWANIFANYLNGIGDAKLQFRLAFIVVPLNIPLSYLFAVSLGLGTAGILLGTLVSLSVFAVLGPISVYRQLNRDLRSRSEVSERRAQ